MIIKPMDGPAGARGQGVIDYLLRLLDSGRRRRGRAPIVIFGNPGIVHTLIRAVPSNSPCLALCFSFKEPLEELRRRGAIAGVLRLIRRVLHAGQMPGSVCYTVVIHQTPGSDGVVTELNVVAVQWNLNYERVQYLFLADLELDLWQQLQRYANLRWGLADPDDSPRQLFRQRGHLPETIREAVGALSAGLREQVLAGAVRTTADVEKFVLQNGFKDIEKQVGKRDEMVWTVCLDGWERRVRLEGTAVQPDFTPDSIKAHPIRRTTADLARAKEAFEQSFVKRIGRIRRTAKQRIKQLLDLTRDDEVLLAAALEKLSEFQPKTNNGTRIEQQLDRRVQLTLGRARNFFRSAREIAHDLPIPEGEFTGLARKMDLALERCGRPANAARSTTGGGRAGHRGAAVRTSSRPLLLGEASQAIDTAVRSAAAAIHELAKATAESGHALAELMARLETQAQSKRGNEVVLSDAAFWQFALDYLRRAEKEGSRAAYSTAEEYAYVTWNGVIVAVSTYRYTGGEYWLHYVKFPKLTSICEAKAEVRLLLSEARMPSGEPCTADELEIEIKKTRQKPTRQQAQSVRLSSQRKAVPIIYPR